jgi:RNA polymerase sigma-70 factor (ECF subfamily)
VKKEDQEILLLIRNERTRTEGFNRLVAHYQHEVYWLIRRMVIDHNDADDLAQETFIKVWKNLPHFRGDSALFTWIYRIAVNEALVFLRKKRIASVLSLSSMEEKMGNALQTDSLYDGDRIDELFQNALLTLPDKQRLVFNMKYFEEMTYEDISSVTGTSTGALKASYHHAVMKIQKILTSG